MIFKLLNKTTCTFIFLFYILCVFSQEKQENILYSYADVKSSITGKTILITEVGFIYDKMIRILQKEGIDAISSEPKITNTDPRSTYSGSYSDLQDLIDKNNVQTILL